MKLKKILCLLFCLLIPFAGLGGCGSEQKYVLYIELNDTPDTLDPQLANGITEELLTRNLFEGLMRLDAEGNVTYGAAESHRVSSDGKTYTFTISESAKWQNGEAVTADDFVYGLTRAVDPALAAPYAASLYGIVGAKERHSGKKVALGITASDVRTLTIRLRAADPNFLKTLTTAIAMPCHRTTYEKAKGQYGKTGEHLLSNGSYRLRYWNKVEDFSLRINKNEEYAGPFAAEAMAVIFSAGTLSGRAARIDEENLDMGFVSRREATDQSQLFTFETSGYALVINRDSAFGGKAFRNAFARSIHRNVLKNELDVSLCESGCLLPGTVKLNGKALSSQMTVTVPPVYDPEHAHETYIDAAGQSKNLPSSIEILYYGDESVTTLAKLVAESFQQSLGAVVNVKATETETDLLTAVESKNYALAILPISAQSEDPAQFFGQFTSQSGGRNIYGYKNSKYDAAVSKITATASTETVTKAAEKALNLLISDLTIIPLALRTEAFAYGNSFSCPTITPFGGVIDLALVRKIS